MVRAPVMTATIERRLLINYQVDPEVLTRVLPAPFRPHLVGGVGLAGICLIRLGNVHPAGGPGVGITTENAAHRIAVEWDTADGPERGVYIPRRDTSSRLTALVGGRLFPGFHGRARFRVPHRAHGAGRHHPGPGGGRSGHRAARGLGVRLAGGGVGLLPAGLGWVVGHAVGRRLRRRRIGGPGLEAGAGPPGCGRVQLL
jgi:hypothetical protein